MKKIIALIFAVFLPVVASAQNWSIETVDIFYTNSNQDTVGFGATATSTAKQLLYADSVVVSIALTVSVEFGATPDGDAKFYVLTSADGTTYDSQSTAYAAFAIAETASTTYVKTIKINPGVKYIKIVAENNDSADDIYVRGWLTLVWSKDNTG